MRILVIGKNGQLGRCIQRSVCTYPKTGNSQSSNDFVFVGRVDIDLSSESSISQFFNNNKFDLIINSAAYTQVDKAEEEEELADQINHLAVRKLAGICNEQQARLVHVSTDFVFDGDKSKPYSETDMPNPINTYGKTKLAGEKALQKVMPTNAIVIRTSWLYSEYGNNFVRTMLRLGRDRNELNVVSDQMGSPTYAADLADAILQIIEHEKFRGSNQTTQIYNYSNNGNISWYEFAKEIFKIENIECEVNPISSKQYPTLAKRAKNTTLDISKIKLQFGIELCDWRSSLNKFFKLKRENVNI